VQLFQLWNLIIYVYYISFLFSPVAVSFHFSSIWQSWVFSTVVLINEYEGVNERLFRAGLYDGPTAPQLIGDAGDEQGVPQDFG